MKILTDSFIFEHSPSQMKMIANHDGCRRYHTMAQKGIHYAQILPHPACEQPLYIPVIYHGKTNANYHYKQEKSPILGVEYIRGGSLAVRQSGRCYLLEPGDVFLLLPDEDNEIMTGPDGFCEKVSFPVQGKLLKPFLKATGLGERECICDFEWQRLDRLVEKLLDLNSKEESVPYVANSLLTYEILELLAFPGKSPGLVPKLARLLEFMRANLEKTLSLETLVNESGLSEINLNKQFRAVYGKTPHQMLMELRMEHAKKLLLSEKKLSIKEIAQLTGYPNPMNFSTAFRHYHGSGPREFRKQKMEPNFNGSYSSANASQ